ncbi:hypothetical protein EW145_g5959 [Phellinidium pouzarii]|uniref:Lysophospholipase n=1 Tax=Phellinidium pouzarii TaxID=167371 RepID=A0A4S4KY75_9AGAM|nr:hypothetical protein EW145_g5959 [Phellinidium pouzarii]
MMRSELGSLLLVLITFEFWTIRFVHAAQSVNSTRQAFTPVFQNCPENFQLVRSAGTTNQSLGPDETAYVSTRQSQVLPGAWSAYVQNVHATNMTLPDYVSSILSGSSPPTLGVTTSGGGYRASIFGAGVLNALDGRNTSSGNAGTGGLLQAATYLAGLSGGSWLVTSAFQANFPTFQEVIFGPPNSTSSNSTDYGGWNAHFDIVAPNNDTAKDLAFYLDIIDEIGGKEEAGFPVTIADFWTRLLARHFVNGTNLVNFFNETSSTHGAGILFSAIANTSSFVNHEIPFPIVIADTYSPFENRSTIMSADEDVVPLTNPIYEFTPFEMGSFDPILAAFAPTKYLGSTNSSVCVTGFDQAAFVVGTSSELFNEFNVTLQDLLGSSVGPLLELINSSFSQPGSVELDVSIYPNPFFGVAPDTFIDSKQEFISLVDGGEDGEVVPIQPLLVRARNVDVIVAIDATSDVDNYAAGSSLVATQNRTTFFPTTYSFPQVPNNTETFVSLNLTKHPTFFGCNDSAPVPLVIYIANGAAPIGQPSLTNTSTDQTTYEPAQIQAMLDQTFVIATQGFPANSSETVDPQWPACLACAVVDRARFPKAAVLIVVTVTVVFLTSTAMEAPNAAKKRKFTDKSLPSSVLHSAEFTDSEFYQQLLDMERKLDWTISRKRAEIQDTLGKPSQTTRTLRIFLSHTASDQVWQTAGQPAGESPDFETGQGIPSWAFKIEGRLLEPTGRSRDKTSLKRFSDVIKHLVVDLERDPSLYPDGNTIEAIPQAGPLPVDGFTVRRTGDSPTKVRVMMYIEHYPDQFKVHPELGAILDIKEESRVGVITSLWNYIKINNLQDKVDRRLIRLDDKLKAIYRTLHSQLSHTETLSFQQIPEFVNLCLLPPDPVLLHYHIKPNEPSPASPQTWDIEIKMEDTSLKSRMNQVILNISSETARDISKYDEETALLAQQIQNAQIKRAFLNAFATEPADFLNKWLTSQSRDLESVLAAGPSEGLTIREEELKRSEFFKLSWVEEAVAVQEGLRMASRNVV